MICSCEKTILVPGVGPTIIISMSQFKDVSELQSLSGHSPIVKVEQVRIVFCCIPCRPQQCPCLDQFYGNAYFSVSQTDVQSQWYWSHYSHWNNLCPHSRHLLSHPTILKNCLIYNLTPLALLVNDHQIRSPRPSFMEDRKQQWLEPGF